MLLLLRRYFYQLGSNNATYVRNFTTLPSSRQPNFVFLADMGYGNGTYTTASLIQLAQQGAFDAVTIVGDQAYDFDTSSSSVGNDYRA